MPAIELRELEPGDEQWIFDACQDADIQRWTLVPRPYTRADAEWFVNSNTELLNRVVVDVGSGQPLGMIGVHTVIDGVADIGYWIAPWGRGRGVATIAVSRLLDVIRLTMSVRSVVARVSVNNRASQLTVERAGFVESARLCDACPDGEHLSDAVVYRLDIDQGPPAMRTAL